MDAGLRRRMLAYYDERAPAYDEAYTLGTGTASLPDAEIFKAEARQWAGIVARTMHGRVMDLACGTAYWLPAYGPSCSRITLFDQSPRMLAEARIKATRLGILERCTFRQGDLCDQDFEGETYDTVLVGFLLSHRSEAQEPTLFEALQTMLDAGGRSWRCRERSRAAAP